MTTWTSAPVTINLTSHTYDVTVNNTTTVATTVTKSPEKVMQWVSNMITSLANKAKENPPTPEDAAQQEPFAPSHLVGTGLKISDGDVPGAILLLCVDEECLIFQASTSTVPSELETVLESEAYHFCGVDLCEKLKKFKTDCMLTAEVVNYYDLEVFVGDKKFHQSEIGNWDVFRLALEEAGIYVERPINQAALWSNVEAELTEEQVKWGCVEAYLALKVAEKMRVNCVGI